MRTLRLEDFEKMARVIVAGYMDNQTPLAEGVAKTAAEEGLNPDQIKSLVQLSNVIAHLQLFDKKNDGDKNVEFTPVDPDDVMKKIYVEPSSSEDAPEKKEVDLSPFPDLMRMMQTCFTPTVPEEEPETPSPRKRQIMVIKIQKVASELENRTLEAQQSYAEGIEKLAMVFRKLYGPDYATFEKEGSSLFSARAVPVFNALRSILGKTAQNNYEKTACVVDSETPLMQSLATTIQAVEEAQLCADGVRFLDEKIGALL